MRAKTQWILVDASQESLEFYGGRSELPVCSAEERTFFRQSDTYIRGETGLPPAESFRSNLLAGMEAVEYDKVLIIEDDDWYHPCYVAMMTALLDVRPLVGSARAKFYNVRHRKYLVHNNTSHASLCQTGFRRELFPKVIEILQNSGSLIPTGPQQLDGTLWRRSGIPAGHKLLLPESPHVVGIKGMPGLPGLGIHHRAEELRGYTDDPELLQLREWIGSDAEFYRHQFEVSE